MYICMIAYCSTELVQFSRQISRGKLDGFFLINQRCSELDPKDASSNLAS
jgi:hypothetical protein